MNKIKKLLFKYNNEKDGYVSIETILVMTYVLIFFLLVVAFFTFEFSRTEIQKDVSTLSTICERQGGLTQDNIVNFKAKMKRYPFIKDSSFEISVTAVTDNGEDMTAVTPLNKDGNDYVSRSTTQIINLTIKIPSNSSFLSATTKILGVVGVNNYYVFYFPVMSERY